MLTSPLLAYCVLGTDGKEPPLARHALQLVSAAVLELEPRPRDEVLDGARDEHLARPSLVGDAGSDVDGDPARLPAVELALAGMDARADVEAEVAEDAPDRARARDGARRAVEAREDAVACGVDLLPAEPGDLGPHGSVVACDQLAPRAVAELRRPLGRADDVGEQHRREDSLRLRQPAHAVHEPLRLADRLLVHVVVDPGEHADEPTQLPDRGARDALGHVRRLVALAALAEDQRRHTNRRED